MTGQDVAEAFIALIVDNITTLNADADLVASGFQFSDVAMPETAGVTDQYKLIKPYDPIVVHEGLTVAVSVGSDRVIQRLAPYFAEREYPIAIICYLFGPGIEDPEKVRHAKTGITRCLSTLLMGRHRITTATGGSLYKIEVGDREYGAGNKKMMVDKTVHYAALALTARSMEQE